VVVFVAPRPDRMAPSRVGLAVARGAGTAVARNRIRRRLRAAWRRTGAPTGLDVVIRARPEAIDAPFQELVDVLAEGQRVVKRPP
jgi:ribonuclease P protein component